MNYCKSCLLPDSRPNLTINQDGICNACLSHSTKKIIDWKKRLTSLIEVFEKAKSKSKSYDCLIPVSGGKDSTWQVVKCLEFGLKPLAVTWKTPGRTPLGQKNLDNLVSLGVDHIDYQINPKLESKFMLETLKKNGSTAIPMHLAMYNIPLRLSVQMEIPLVIWGENSAFEYGGTEEEAKGFKMDSQWLKKFGVTNGTTALDWVSDELTKKDLSAYFGPTDDEMIRKDILAIFLGYYLPWDVEESLRVAKLNGFIAREEGPMMGFYNYADIDDYFMSIHHWLKWYKFGITRLWDNLSLEIRNGRIDRNSAIEIIRIKSDETPYDDIERFCRFVSIEKSEFFTIIEKFRNPNIWKKMNEKWVIPNFLISDWEWK
ncbi:MAG: N-acetyl sugar amidotransferase [Leptospiraceae bacterium]|nr:N-acetyl sugar amidotransferase [Leptospiraceae bacterium]